MTRLENKRNKLKKTFDDAWGDPGQNKKQKRENRRRIKKQMTKLDRRTNKKVEYEND